MTRAAVLVIEYDFQALQNEVVTVGMQCAPATSLRLFGADPMQIIRNLARAIRVDFGTIRVK
ncbi:hypothetical protein VI26_00325 [Chromobacterium sp. LK1]|nr:hypothetical protein VI26_00325 [Chromobacterium sp. LK1]